MFVHPVSGEDPGLTKKNRSEALYIERRDIYNILLHELNILDNFNGLFYLNTFGARRSIDVLDSENQSGSDKIRAESGALRLTEDI